MVTLRRGFLIPISPPFQLLKIKDGGNPSGAASLTNTNLTSAVVVVGRIPLGQNISRFPIVSGEKEATDGRTADEEEKEASEEERRNGQFKRLFSRE